LRFLFGGGGRTTQQLDSAIFTRDGILLDLWCPLNRGNSIPTKLKDEEWRRIITPMLVLAGEHEKIYHPAKAMKYMKRVAPHVKMEVIEGAGHDLPVVQVDIVNQKVIEFLSAKG
jgi:pimeloyl-ACP methyl ester carboxylesterase